MNQRAMLFINYIEFFHKSHTKYLKRFTMKVNLMLSQLKNDIKMDSPMESKTVKKDMIADLKDQNVDRDLLKELRVSISADDMSVHSQSRASGSASSDESGDKFPSQEEEYIPPEFIIHRPMIETLSELTDEPDAKKIALFSPSSYESLRRDPSPSSEQQIEWGEQPDPFIEPVDEEENINLTIYIDEPEVIHV
jgi:hypothetical protein